LKRAVTAEGIETTPNNLDVIQDANIIILAVKPAQMANVLAEISASIPRKCLLISVAAGLNLAWFAKHTLPNTAVIRAMPNIAAAVKRSATPLIKNQYVSEHQHNIAQQLFNTIGISTWVQREADIDIFTALSGSGPAYVFQFIQGMITAAVHMGLDEHTATAFALETVSGAAALAIESKQDLQQLTDQVTSKGGTTAAALHVFHDRQFSHMIESAMIAAQNRAQELDYT
jgi:pyrroline-5-carboxylate reductase